MRNTSTNFARLTLLIALTYPISSASATELKSKDYKVSKPTNRNRSGYSIELAYPIFRFADSRKQQKLNQLAFAPYEKQANGFVSDMKLNPPESGRLPHLGGGFRKVFDNDRLVSVRYESYIDSGGAHPSHMSVARTFALDSGEVVQLGRFFKKKSDYLILISKQCRLELYKGLGQNDEWVNRGTEPTEANFSVFHPSNAGLTFIFPQYQVASYADGIQEVTIPWANLSEVVEPSFLKRYGLLAK